MLRAVVAGIAVVAIGAAESPAPRWSPQLNACETRPGGSRWLTNSYEVTHTYGIDDPDQWVASYGGLDAVGDSVFLYDQMRPGVLHLSGTLSLRQSFGRAGQGPGEFDFPFPVSWIDDISEGHIGFDGTTLAVYDRMDLALFGPDGTFLRSARLGDLSMGAGVRFVSSELNGSMVYGMDSIGLGKRRLQTWRVRPDDGRELLWERSIPWTQPVDGKVRPEAREARSYWARLQRCYVMSDGGGDLLWIHDPLSGSVDSIPLPDWTVPDFGDVAVDRSTIVIGGRNASGPKTEPALMSRWTGLIVDPDGYAWVRAWTPTKEKFTVFVISLESGQAAQRDLPGFPTAFGPPGVFYTAQMKSDTDEHYVARYEGREE